MEEMMRKEEQQEEKKERKEEYRVLTVMFEVTKKRYFFEVPEGVDYQKGDYVIVETIRGEEIGLSCGKAMMVAGKSIVLPLKPVLKKATESEIENYLKQRKDAKQAFQIGKEQISKHKLPMKLVETEYTFDRSKLIFYFTAEGRIDFRDLVKDLANIFKIRIELRQIGVRDEARILGTVGLCGRELCCRSFINKFDSVSIKMARDQGLVINPTKISGVCGRLLCCINYEYQQYEEALRHFPAVNQMVVSPDGDGKVLSIAPLLDQVYIDVFGKGMMKYSVHDIKFNKKEANKLKNVKSKEDVEHKKLEKE